MKKQLLQLLCFGFLLNICATKNYAQWNEPVPTTLFGVNGGHFGLSLKEVNGRPAMAHYNETNFELHYVRASNSNGTSWGSPITVDNDWRSGNNSIDMEIVNGNPAIVSDSPVGKDVRYTRATDANGTSWGTTVLAAENIATTYGGTLYLDLEVINGNPAVAYIDGDNLDLYYVRANDANGTSWGSPVLVTSTGNVGSFLSMTMVDGRPAISYYDATNGDLEYVRANNSTGSSWGTPIVVASTNDVGRFTSLAIVNGNPAIAYGNFTSKDLMYVRASNSTGTSWGSAVIVHTAYGEHCNLMVVNGLPAIGYYTGWGNQDLVYIQATNVNGTAWGSQNVLDNSSVAVGTEASMAIINGKPAIGYRDYTNSDLKYTRSSNASGCGESTFYQDSDNDGYGNPSVTTQACAAPAGYVSNNTDCDDNDVNEHPGQTWYLDADGDDYGTGNSTTSCTRPSNYYLASELTQTFGDCNDGDSNIKPGATEVCDGIDNNCNSQTDEGVSTTYYQDSDSDGFGNPAMTTQACSQPAGYVTDNTDCDDNDANEYPGQTWYKDADGDDYGDGTSQTACTRPANHYIAAELTATSGDCNDSNANIHPGASELCNNIDDDCNTLIDDGASNTYYQDSDSDGYGNPGVTASACSAPAGYVSDNTDCDDTDANEYPGQTWYKDTDGDDYSDGTSQTSCARPANYFLASELTQTSGDCDDNDANEFPGQTWYNDADGDDYGDGSSQTACLRPANHYLAGELTATSGDCNDGNAAINPGATEVCDGVDNNCNTQTDEGLLNTYYQDSDSDGFGDAGVMTQACSAPAGYVADNTDCDDTDADEFPGQTWYKDADGDDYGDGSSQTSCTRPANHYTAAELTATSGDCNDANAAINPGASEICNRVDDDCNTLVDDGVTFQNYYLDSDGDGFGTGAATNACSPPSANHVTQTGDCNDGDANIHPNAT